MALGLVKLKLALAKNFFTELVACQEVDALPFAFTAGFDNTRVAHVHKFLVEVEVPGGEAQVKVLRGFKDHTQVGTIGRGQYFSSAVFYHHPGIIAVESLAGFYKELQVWIDAVLDIQFRTQDRFPLCRKLHGTEFVGIAEMKIVEPQAGIDDPVAGIQLLPHKSERIRFPDIAPLDIADKLPVHHIA